MSSPEFPRVDARDFRFGPFNFFPAGRLLVNNSELSPDIETQAGFEKANTILNETGLLILDAHRTELDIVFTASRITQELQLRTFVTPVASYLYEKPKYRKKLEQIARTVKGSELFPVVRAEESGRTEREGLDPNSLTLSEKRRLNRRYLHRATQVIKEPHSAAIVAPYGSRLTYGQEVRKGVLSLVRRESPVIFTFSERTPKRKVFGIKGVPFHRLYASDVVLFSRENSDEYISMIIDTQFASLERRAGII